MFAYATVDDLVQRWPDLPEARFSVAEVLLGDAATLIRAYVREDIGDVDPDVLVMVSCAMVKRALIGAETGGVSALDLQAGPFAERRQFSNPTGDLYLSKAEKDSLSTASRGRFTIGLIPDSSPFADEVTL